MLGNSILNGFHLAIHPEVFLLSLLLIGLNMGFLISIRYATRPTENQDTVGPGCLVQVISLLFQGILIAIFVLLLLPILLGVGNHISWKSVEPMGFIAARSGILAMAILSFLCFFPFLGKFISSSPGIETFLLGALTFRFLSPKYIEAFLGEKSANASLYPNVWQSLIFLVLAFLFTRVLILIIVNISNILKKQGARWERTVDFVLNILGPSLDILGGLLPFFMYACWVKLSILNMLP